VGWSDGDAIAVKERAVAVKERAVAVKERVVALAVNERVVLILLVLLVAVSMIPVIWRDDGASNLHVLQAAAWLDGRLDIDHYAPDVAEYGGRNFIPFPPAPAAVLLPFVAAFGTHATNPPLVATFLFVVDVFVMRRLLIQLGVGESVRTWILIAFFAGSPLWSSLLWTDGVWFFSHVVGVTFILLALTEVFGRRRGWLVGLLLGCAFLSRQLYIISAIFLIAALLRDQKTSSPARRRLIGFGIGVGVCVLAYLVLNWARFGDPLETGYRYIDLTAWPWIDQRIREHGIFSPAYIPFNLITFLINGVHVEFTSPDKLQDAALSPFGISLVAACPFIFVGLYANRRDLLVRAALAVVLLTFAAQTFYYLSGYGEYGGVRFALDYLAVWMIPVAWGLEARQRKGEATPWLWAIGWSVMLTAFTVAMRYHVVNWILHWWEGIF
jgi:hypothetical protein